MQHKEFYKRFGGSFRTMHIKRPKSRFSALSKKNKRIYSMPETSELPLEYIRLDPWEAEYLFHIASRAKQGIVETGRFHGGSTFMMACANANVPIHSVDIAPQNDEVLKSYFQKFHVGSNVELIVGDSQNVKYPQVKQYDVLYIDGDHSYEGCTKDLENWYPGLSVGGHVVLHDCYEGCEVKDSVIDFLAKHPELVAMTTPFKDEKYWLPYPEGSMMHMIKRA